MQSQEQAHSGPYSYVVNAALLLLSYLILQTEVTEQIGGCWVKYVLLDSVSEKLHKRMWWSEVTFFLNCALVWKTVGIVFSSVFQIGSACAHKCIFSLINM